MDETKEEWVKERIDKERKDRIKQKENERFRRNFSEKRKGKG